MFVCGCVLAAHGQGTTETMLEQIAALRTLIGSVEKGYQVVEKGLTTIGQIKKGEFDLHAVFFGSLSTVDPAVRGSPDVSAVLRWQGAIDDAFSQAMVRYRVSPWLQPGERDYLQYVYTRVVNDCGQDAEAMGVLTRDGVVQMTDGERIRRMELIGAGMQQRATRVQAFLFATDLLINRRQAAGNFSGMLSSLYGIQ